MAHGDAVALLYGRGDPGDVVIDPLIAAPGVPIDRLAACVRQDAAPVFGRLIRLRGRAGQRQGDEEACKKQAHGFFRQ